MPCFYLNPEQDNVNQELQVCIAEALYDVDSIVADPEAYTKEELAALHSQIVSNLERRRDRTTFISRHGCHVGKIPGLAAWYFLVDLLQESG